MSTLFPYTTLFRSDAGQQRDAVGDDHEHQRVAVVALIKQAAFGAALVRFQEAEEKRAFAAARATAAQTAHEGSTDGGTGGGTRSEEHTSELQSRQCLHSFPTRRSSDLMPASSGMRSVMIMNISVSP